VSEHTQQRIDDAIRAIVMAGFDQASAILVAHRALLERGAKVLLEKETLDEAAIGELRAQIRVV
jgi:cell division protease FtsH